MISSSSQNSSNFISEDVHVRPGPSSSSVAPSTSASSSQQQSANNQRIFHFSIDPKHFVAEDYFSLEHAFALNTNISCTFEPNTPRDIFALLGQKAPEVIPEKGHRANVPAWILPAIDHVSSFTVPTVYNAVNRDVIHAGAQSTNLEQLQRHYYSLGTFICGLVSGEQGREIAMALLVAFTQRIGRILRDCIRVNAKPTRLDETEKRIFWAIQKAEQRKEEWLTNRLEEGRHRRSAKRKHGATPFCKISK